jgi:hypothetical protein
MKKYSNENIFLNSVNDLTRQAYKSDNRNTPLNNSPLVSRFENDVFITKKESFETNNAKINDLNDEISELKSKLRLLTEKDDKIFELEIEIKKIDSEKSELAKKIDRLRGFESENIRLKNENDGYQIDLMNMKSIQQRNELLTKKLLELSAEKDEDEKDIAIDEEIKTEDKIKVDIEKIKQILNNRLKSYHEDHIQKLMMEYELEDKEYITKSDLTDLLSKAIHI